MIGVGQIVANEKSTAYNDVSLDGAGRACIFRRAHCRLAALSRSAAPLRHCSITA
jgi:hypothetical protein